MKSLGLFVNNQKGIATTEMVVVSFIFILILAAFLILSNTILSKIDSLIQVRNLAFNQTGSEDLQVKNFKRVLVREGQARSFPMDRCLSVYLASKPSRVQAEVQLKTSSSLMGEVLKISNIIDRFRITEDSWQGLNPVLLGNLVANCPG